MFRTCVASIVRFCIGKLVYQEQSKGETEIIERLCCCIFFSLVSLKFVITIVITYFGASDAFFRVLISFVNVIASKSHYLY